MSFRNQPQKAEAGVIVRPNFVINIGMNPVFETKSLDRSDEVRCNIEQKS